jgi:hypothetical protein
MKNPEAQAIVRQQGLSLEEARRRYEAETPARVEARHVTRSTRSSDAAAGAEPARQQQDAGARPISTARFVAAVKAVTTSSPSRAGVFRGVDVRRRDRPAVVGGTPAAVAGRGPGRDPAPHGGGPRRGASPPGGRSGGDHPREGPLRSDRPLPPQ